MEPYFTEPEKIGEKISFHLETEGIEAKALIRILQDTHLTFREIAIAESLPETELKVFPFQQGSFEYALELIAAANVAAAAIGTFREIVSYKKAKMEYEKAKSEASRKGRGTSKIKMEVELPKALAKNSKINFYMNGMLKTIGDHSAGFSFSGASHPNGQYLSSKEINNILAIEKDNSEPSERKTIETDYVKLSLVKLSDKPYGKWEFLYDGVRIKAEVSQSLKRAALFRKFRPGMLFYAILSIRQEYNPTGRAWQNISYKVTKVDKIETP